MYKSFFKRLIDVFLAFIVIVLLSPLLIIISLIIKFQDGGPVLFKQDRVGKNKVLFRIYKFRSMPVNTANVESHEVNKITITPFGKLIRRTNIDELPQFFNIMKGDMSLIGPRPCIPSQENLINLRYEGGAYSCLPGLTGLAQVNSYDNMPNEVKAKYDNEYANTISLMNDMKIVLNTFIYLTKEPPAY